MTNMFKLTPKQTKKAIMECLEVGLVPFVRSSPGLGKSSINAEIAKLGNLEMIDLRLSQLTPEDFMGLPMRNAEGTKAQFMPFGMFPLKGDPLPPGKDGWLLNLDEFNSGAKMVQAASYKLVLDRMVGQEHLHENVYIVCAGNLESDRAIVNQLSTAMQSRLIHIEMTADLGDWMEYAIKKGIDHRITGFLEFMPGKLHEFRPDHNDVTFACPRTWEFASRLVKGKKTSEVSQALLAGTLSAGVATELMTFMEEFDKLPSYAEIVKDPLGLPQIYDTSTAYAVVSMLQDKVVEADFVPVAAYVKRLQPEFQTVFFRGCVARNPSIRRTRNFVDAVKHLTKFLMDDPASAMAA